MTDLAVKPRRFGAWYVFEHKIQPFRTWAWSLVAMAFGTPLIYLYSFGVGFASLLGRQADATVGGVSYLEFMAPAALLAFVLQAGSEEFYFGTVSGFTWNRTFYGMRAAPLTATQISAGMVLVALARMLFTSLVYFGIGWLVFGAFPSPWSWLIIPISLLAACAFGLPLMAFAASVESDKGQFAMVYRVVIMPLSLFSGTMFPLDVLPVWLQWIGWISPLWHGSQLTRIVSYGLVEPAWLIVVHLAMLAALVVAGWILTVRLMGKRLDG